MLGDAKIYKVLEHSAPWRLYRNLAGRQIDRNRDGVHEVGLRILCMQICDSPGSHPSLKKLNRESKKPIPPLRGGGRKSSLLNGGREKIKHNAAVEAAKRRLAEEPEEGGGIQAEIV